MQAVPSLVPTWIFNDRILELASACSIPAVGLPKSWSRRLLVQAGTGTSDARNMLIKTLSVCEMFLSGG